MQELHRLGGRAARIHARDQDADGIQLFVPHRRWRSGVTNDRDDTRRPENIVRQCHAEPGKHVAGKQREPHAFPAVRPLPHLLQQREVRFHAAQA